MRRKQLHTFDHLLLLVNLARFIITITSAFLLARSAFGLQTAFLAG
jgi:hypothetical protein